MSKSRMCPRAYPLAPHELRQDDNGAWYCPIERDAEAAAAAYENYASPFEGEMVDPELDRIRDMPDPRDDALDQIAEIASSPLWWASAGVHEVERILRETGRL